MSAYALVDRTYKDYRAKVDELFGTEAGAQVRAGIAKDKYEEQHVEPQGDNILYYDFYSGRYFESTPTEVKKAEYELNRTLMLDDCACINDWYKFLDLEPVEHGDNVGWTTYANSDAYWQTWVDFHHENTIMDDGLECTIISFNQDPYPDFEEWC